MSRCPWSSVPLTALALLVVGCGREARQGAATARADSATTTPAGPADFRAPGSAAMAARAPATFRARFETSKGAFVIEVQRDWAPLGARSEERRVGKECRTRGSGYDQKKTRKER